MACTLIARAFSRRRRDITAAPIALTRSCSETPDIIDQELSMDTTLNLTPEQNYESSRWAQSLVEFPTPKPEEFLNHMPSDMPGAFPLPDSLPSEATHSTDSTLGTNPQILTEATSSTSPPAVHFSCETGDIAPARSFSCETDIPPIVPFTCETGDIVLDQMDRPVVHGNHVQIDPVSSSQPINQEDPAPSPIKCGVCFEEIEGAYSTPCRQCHSRRCHACLRKEFTTALRDMAYFPVTCCGAVWHFDVARGIVPDSDIELYRLRFEEKNTAHPLYCPIATCSAFIPKRLIPEASDVVDCPVCQEVVCLKCKQSKNPGNQHTCQELDPFLALLKRFKYKTCPKCGIAVARMFGCPHMKCYCGAHWCWDCRRSVNECNESCQMEEADYDENEDVSNTQDTQETQETPNTQVGQQIQVPEDVQQTQSSPDTQQTQNIQDTEQINAEGPPHDVMITDSTSERTEVGDNQQVSNKAQPEAFTNLDDPRATRWDTTGEDFGAEPSEGWGDIWGCEHRTFREFHRGQMPPFWLNGIKRDQDEDIKIGCMNCWKEVKIGQKPNTAQPDDAMDVDSATDLAYECYDCTVIYCWDCKAAEMKSHS